MKKKANIYDADDVERSKRLNFTPEERAARAEHKAEVLGTKLEKAKKKVPKKKKLRLQKELDPEKSKLKHTLRFEEVEKKRGQEALPKKAGRRMVQSASATVHSKIHQVEEENVGTKAAHRTELASEGAAALASHEIRKYRQNAPYKRVEKLEAQVNRANVSAAYRAAVRDNPELQENTVKRLIQKQRIKHQYAKEFRKAKQAEKQETIILFNESESAATVYTYNTGLQNTLNSLCQSHPEQVTQTGDNGYGGLTYSLPKKWVKIAPPRVLSEAQKKVLEDMNRKNKERKQQ